MRHYETLFIVNPDLSEEDTTATVEKFSAILTDAGSSMVKTDLWGRRRLAYEVKKFSKGYYVLFEYGALPETVAEMERNFKIDERVIRYLTVKKEDVFDAEAVAKAQAEAEAKAAARAAREQEELESPRRRRDDDDDEGEGEFEDEEDED
ncbi:MAG: 30S ribosomal protein S6 [Desulfarculus sp.]|nr:30S ribosomal protein S6 [Desulfarculus sp.]